MKNYEQIKQMDCEQFSDWLEEYGQYDGSPWSRWFDKNYCKNCEDIECVIVETGTKISCVYCEVYSRCKFFLEKDSDLETREIINLWLESEVEQ